MSWLLAGCAGENRTSTGPDPLLGGGPPIRPAAQASAPPASAVAGPAPLPAPSSSTSTAALANGAFTPLDPTHDLRIGAGGAQPGANAAVGNAWQGQSAAPDVMLRRPEPAAETPPTARPPAPGFALTATGPVTTFEQAQAQLRAHGVTWQRLENSGDTGEWKFSCAIPNRQNPNIRQTYEARAQDQLAAIRAVLDQIEREQR